MMKSSLLVLSLLVLLASCGARNDEQKQIAKMNLGVPVTGVANESTESSFVLVTLPEKFGDAPAKRIVNIKDAKVVDSQGKEAKITDNSTVKVEGFLGEGEIIATTVTVEAQAVDLGVHLKQSETLFLQTAELIAKLLKDAVPPNFGDGWKLEETGSLRDVPGSKIMQYNKSEWKLILVDNPKTPDKYEITLYGPNKFLWAGVQDASGKIIQRK
jgi:hypothetical protein